MWRLEIKNFQHEGNKQKQKQRQTLCNLPLIWVEPNHKGFWEIDAS